MTEKEITEKLREEQRDGIMEKKCVMEWTKNIGKSAYCTAEIKE